MGDASDGPPPTAEPQVCLSVAPDVVDASVPTPTPDDAGAPRYDAGIRIPPPAPPHPCLSPKLPDRE